MCKYKLSDKEVAYPKLNWISECGLQVCIMEGFNTDYNSDKYGSINTPSGSCMKCRQPISTTITEVDNKKDCPHCEFISKTFNGVHELTPREYWLMTEVFVYLHKSDVCNLNK